VTTFVGRGRRVVEGGLRERDADVRHLRASLTALGPAATLSRGYAIVQAGSEVSSPVLRSADEVGPGDVLRVRLADGAVHARVEAPE
jgi:exodeoxyribonuclease VII large subunit